jgi:SAM-dependent methyltransferase
VIADAYGDDELAALYDLFHFDYDDDVAMFEQFARRGETASLELGAGSGRVALRLAAAGLDVVALDDAAPMLRRLRERLDATTAPRVRTVEADMRDFDLGERFHLVFCAANSFQHLLTRDDQLAALACVRRHLAEGGVYVATLKAPAGIDWSDDGNALRLRATRIDPATGDTVTHLEAAAAHANEWRTHVTWTFDRVPAGGGPVRRRSFDVALRIFGKPEIELLLRAAGLRLAHVYGSFDLSPFTHDSDTMVVVAQEED